LGADYEKTVQQALSARDPESRLRFAARIARQIHDTQSATFDLLRGAGVVAPELAKLEQQRECVRYERQGKMINLLRDVGRLRPDLGHRTARDIFWMFTGRDVYRMLVRERGWSPQKYEEWLADTLVRSLLTPGSPSPVRSRAAKRGAWHGHITPTLRRSYILYPPLKCETGETMNQIRVPASLWCLLP
jgi:hypothetical protein